MVQTVDSSSSADAEIRGKVTRDRPKWPLPTNRIAFSKQVDTLRAFIAASGPQLRLVGLAEVAELMKMTASTISLSTPFFVDAGLLERTESGKFAPTQISVEFARAHEWNRETAAHRLAPAFQSTWFWQKLQMHLRVRDVLPESEAVQVLAEEAAASKEYEPQLRLLIEYLELVGLVRRDGQSIKSGKQELSETRTPRSLIAEPASETKKQPTSAVLSPQPEGIVSFSVAIRVDVTELSTWSPDRITAFFAGLAQVIAAKSSVEES